MAATVLPVACAVADTVGDVMDALQERVAAGLTPLHLAVRSRNAELVHFFPPSVAAESGSGLLCYDTFWIVPLAYSPRFRCRSEFSASDR